MSYTGGLGTIGKWWTKISRYDGNLVRAIDATGFGGIARALPKRMPNLSHSAVSAMGERWSETTHTFHLPFGEVTITPSDVVAMTGLPWKGDVIHFDAFLTKYPVD